MTAPSLPLPTARLYTLSGVFDKDVSLTACFDTHCTITAPFDKTFDLPISIEA